MGKGDKRTKRGKITSSSYGNSRPKSKKATYKKPEEVVAEVATEEAKVEE